MAETTATATATVPPISDVHDAAALACCARCGVEHLALLACSYCAPCPCGSGDPAAYCVACLDTPPATYVQPSPEAEAALEAAWQEQVADDARLLVAAGVVPELARRVAEGNAWRQELGDIPPCG